MNSNRGIAGFMQKKKMPVIRDKFGGDKRMWRQNYRLSAGNRLSLRKTKIKRDLPRG